MAGRLSSVAPHVSLTNKALPIDDLDVNYSSALLQNLLQNFVLLVRSELLRRYPDAIVCATKAAEES